MERDNPNIREELVQAFLFPHMVTPRGLAITIIMEDDFPSPLSSSKRSACSASPSVKKRPKIDWSPIQLNVLEEANDFITSLWPNFQPAFHSDAEGTDPERRRALAGILSTLTTKLHATGMRDSDFTPRQAQVIVDGFDDKALGDWMVSVKKGMEGNWTDWMDLIEHRMHYLTLRPFGEAKDVKQPCF